MQTSNRQKILHIISGLDTGGAEMMLYKLVEYSNHDQFDIEVISLSNIGPIGKRLRHLNIPVHSMNILVHGIPNPFFFLKLLWYVRKIQPDIIQTWMYHADLFGATAAKDTCKIP